MTPQLSMIHESLTQARVLLFDVLSDSKELPAELRDKVGLQKTIADAHNAIVRAIISASSATEPCASDIGVSTREVRKLLTILQNSAHQEVIESSLVRRVATALTLLFELEKINEQNLSRNVSPNQRPIADESISHLKIGMHEVKPHGAYYRPGS